MSNYLGNLGENQSPYSIVRFSQSESSQPNNTNQQFVQQVALSAIEQQLSLDTFVNPLKLTVKVKLERDDELTRNLSRHPNHAERVKRQFEHQLPYILALVPAFNQKTQQEELRIYDGYYIGHLRSDIKEDGYLDDTLFDSVSSSEKEEDLRQLERLKNPNAQVKIHLFSLRPEKTGAYIGELEKIPPALLKNILQASQMEGDHQIMLGWRLFLGLNVERSEHEAIEWFKKSISEEQALVSPEHLLNFADCVRSGLIPDIEPNQALKYYIEGEARAKKLSLEKIQILQTIEKQIKEVQDQLQDKQNAFNSLKKGLKKDHLNSSQGSKKRKSSHSSQFSQEEMQTSGTSSQRSRSDSHSQTQELYYQIETLEKQLEALLKKQQRAQAESAKAQESIAICQYRIGMYYLSQANLSQEALDKGLKYLKFAYTSKYLTHSSAAVIYAICTDEKREYKDALAKALELNDPVANCLEGWKRVQSKNVEKSKQGMKFLEQSAANGFLPAQWFILLSEIKKLKGNVLKRAERQEKIDLLKKEIIALLPYVIAFSSPKLEAWFTNLQKTEDDSEIKLLLDDLIQGTDVELSIAFFNFLNFYQFRQESHQKKVTAPAERELSDYLDEEKAQYIEKQLGLIDIASIAKIERQQLDNVLRPSSYSSDTVETNSENSLAKTIDLSAYFAPFEAVAEGFSLSFIDELSEKNFLELAKETINTEQPYLFVMARQQGSNQFKFYDGKELYQHHSELLNTFDKGYFLTLNSLEQAKIETIGSLVELKAALPVAQWMTAEKLDERYVELGRLYQNGILFKKEADKSRAYYEMAAKQSNPEAYYQLSKIYKGEEAFEALEKAVRLDHPQAFIDYVQDLLQDRETQEIGFKLLEKKYQTLNTQYQDEEDLEFLVQQEYATIASILCRCYLNGEGTAVSLEESKLVANAAYSLGAQEPMFDYLFYQINNQNEANQQIGFHELSKLQNINDAKLFWLKGMCYYKGIGTKVDIEQATDLFKEAAERKHLDSVAIYSQLLVDQNKSSSTRQAYNLLTQYENTEHAEIQKLLGILYLKGLSTDPQSIKMAQTHLRNASKLGAKFTEEEKQAFKQRQLQRMNSINTFSTQTGLDQSESVK